MKHDKEACRERELIAFGRYIDWQSEARLGTVFFGPSSDRQFPPLPTGTVKELAEAGFLDLDASHNEAPSAGALVDWADHVRERYSEYQLEVGLIGYMVDQDRFDTRIAIEGVSIRSPGVLPGNLQRWAAVRFDPDLFIIDDFNVAIQWD